MSNTRNAFQPLTILTLSISFLALVLVSCATPAKKDILFQASTYAALSQGMYNGDLSFEELQTYGDFGLGTFNDLDGEMIALDHIFYQAKTDGRLYKVSVSKTLTPFSILTFFHPEMTKTVIGKTDQQELKKYIDGLLDSKNKYYAIKVVGHFEYIKIRSVPAQSRPYPKLSETIKSQSVSELKDVEGTLVGFWGPDYASKISIPGYHFHFISRDHQRGGHLLDCITTNVLISIDAKDTFYLKLPSTNDFKNLAPAQDTDEHAEK